MLEDFSASYATIPHKVLAAHEEREKKKKKKKKKDLGACLEQRRHSPRQRSENVSEETIYPARREAGEILLRSLRICQYPLRIAILRATNYASVDLASTKQA
jgi:hypothetical protein